MACLQPGRRLTVAGMIAVPCGRCANCSAQVRHRWVMRQELEAEAHAGVAVFVTLTFGWWSLPDSDEGVKAAMQSFVKRLRRWIEFHATPEDLASIGMTPAMVAGAIAGQFRFLGVVERGSKSTRRLHAHLNLFGLSLDMRFGGLGLRRLIRKAWQGRGHVKARPFVAGDARYVAKYLLKCPLGRIMSKGGRGGLGGLGAPAIPALAAVHGPVGDGGDVGSDFELEDGRRVRLDRYLVSRLRVAVGMSSRAIRLASARRLRAMVEACRDARWIELSAEVPAVALDERLARFCQYWQSWRL